MITEDMIDDMRNALTGFGCWLADPRDEALDLYCEADNGKRMIVSYDNGQYIIYRENEAPEIAGQGDFSTRQMLESADRYGAPVQYDDVATSDDPEEYSDELDNYQEETLRRLGLTV
jgi:hypothetical protein